MARHTIYNVAAEANRCGRITNMEENVITSGRHSREQLRVIQYGCGRMGRLLARFAYEKGARIVGAIDSNSALIGRDIGEVAGLSHGLNVVIREDAAAVFNECAADVCIIAIASYMDDMYEHLERAARHGVNAITTCDESFYPWNTSPLNTSRLDRIAKDNLCTLCGSGDQDVFWGNLATVLAGAHHRIDRMETYISFNVDEYGIALAKAHGAGLSEEQFEREFRRGSRLPSTFINGSDWVVSRMGWTSASQVEDLLPVIADREVRSTTLDQAIPAGAVIGLEAMVTTSTHQGPVVVFHGIGKVYAAGETDRNDWFIYGEPNTECTIRQPATVDYTCATIVNRLPSLVEAPPGWVTTDLQPIAEYRTYPLHEYLR